MSACRHGRNRAAPSRKGARSSTAPTWPQTYTAAVTAIAELAADRVVEGTYAVARKRKLRTRSGTDYLALELVDPSGRIEGRIWKDVDLLDSRFDEGDAVRVLGRVERFRDRLQLEVRTLEPAAG